MNTSRRLKVLLAGLGLAALTAGPATAADPSCDELIEFETCNAAVQVVIATAAPVIFQDVSPTGGDATMVLRVTTMITNAWFDATAPYNPNGAAVGVYTRLGHRPAAESTNTNMNIALMYGSYQVLLSLLPHRADMWRQMLLGVGLDPADPATADPTTPHGIGTAAGLGVVAGRLNDGMNQTGLDGGRSHNPTPYADTTGYHPVNTAYRLVAPSRWQPDLQRQGMGIYRIQQFVTPQFGLTEPYSYPDPQAYSVPPPVNSRVWRFLRYKLQADQVLAESADLDDAKKMKAELFDNKIRGLGFSAVDASFAQGLTLLEFVELDFVTNMAAFDAGIFVWQEKRQYDAVRPFSAIRFIYRDSPVTGWGGPGQGTVNDLPADEWVSYLEEADHPEYPSASTCFCYAHAQAARNYLPMGDNLNWTVSFPAGSSRIEPGLVPAAPLDLHFATWTEFAADCGQSRVWAGVHFQSAVDESAAVCDTFGDLASDYLASLVDGSAPVRPPAQGLPH